MKREWKEEWKKSGMRIEKGRREYRNKRDGIEKCYIFTINWLGLVLWHINHCRLFNAKSSLYIYIKYIWFGLVEFYGISTIVGYLMPNPTAGEAGTNS